MAGFRSDRMAELRQRLDISQAELGRRTGHPQSTINRIEQGLTRNPNGVAAIARELGTSVEFLLDETDDPGPAGALQEPRRSYSPAPRDDRVLEIPVIDLAYGMGGTYLDDVDPETRLEPFPLSFIRRYTKAKAEDLVIADGLGDSMAPTIGSNDQMLIDRSVDTVRIADQIWAFSFGGVGMVKRLRPRPDGSIAILSDNPSVPEDRAVDDELFVIGRVVAIVRKV
ncbi:MAG: helix-turn-helix transcriptional regulator [Sphingomonadales bacterium]|nr:helix-turn-helix transcriptional regulator [Sphingomonadales bacterium]